MPASTVIPVTARHYGARTSFQRLVVIVRPTGSIPRGVRLAPLITRTGSLRPVLDPGRSSFACHYGRHQPMRQ